MADSGNDTGSGWLRATGKLVAPPFETLASGVPISRVELEIGEDVPLTVIARDSISKKLVLMDARRPLVMSGRLVLHNWRTGAGNKNACVLEVSEIEYA